MELIKTEIRGADIRNLFSVVHNLTIKLWFAHTSVARILKSHVDS